MMADKRVKMIAQMEKLHQEYNQLSQLLVDQSHHPLPSEGTHVNQVQSSTGEEATVDALKREVKNFTNQLRVLTAEKGDLEKALQQKKNESTKYISKLKQELKESKDDIDVLKDILKRLNEQLNRYHIKHGRLREEERRPITKDITRSSIYKLKSLLTAYDELLLERDDIIKSSTETHETLMLKVDSVTTENEKLHSRLEQLQSAAPIGSEDVGMVASDARLLLEEREILFEEIQTLRQQHQQETTDHYQEVRTLQDTLEELDVKVHSLSSDLNSWKIKSAQLEKQCQAFQTELRDTVTKQEHQLAVDECQRLFEELRLAYSHESGNMRGKMRAVKHEKQDIAEKLTDTSVHAHNLSVQVSGLKGSLRKTEHRVQRREQSLKTVQSAARLAQSRLKSLTLVCSELLEDREKLLESLAAQRKETEELTQEVTLRSAAVGALSQKLKEERLVWSSQIAESEGGRKAAKAAWKRSSREASHLRSLVVSKDETIASLIADYKILGLNYSEAKQHNLRHHIPKYHKYPGGAV
ncbi:centrosomal protein of 89 kDa-like isoform X2 [Homarus americanus]|uniref:centrosomal protein of 89 kDa-like isoform X2 n=1 Tax=Homarus americanus TaxID=6706 RepID=UPI001C462273|nr:centrosomal protein of 89 kDa-like isoform X2 [Homarus americanus]